MTNDFIGTTITRNGVDYDVIVYYTVRGITHSALVHPHSDTPASEQSLEVEFVAAEFDGPHDGELTSDDIDDLRAWVESVPDRVWNNVFGAIN